MAVTAVRQISSTLKIGDDREREYTVLYEVQSDAPTSDGPLTIASAASLPSPGVQYTFGSESDPDAVCIGAAGDIQYRDVSDSRRIWVVPVKFATTGVTGGSGQDGQSGPQQIDGPWVVSGDVTGRMIAKLSDLDDQPLTNSAEERFVPALESQLNMATIKLSRKTSSLDFLTWLTTVDAINSAAFWGQLAYTWKCLKWSWSVQWRGSNAYVQNDVELQYNASGWLVKPVDFGRRYVDVLDPFNDDGTTKYKPVKQMGELSAEGVFLDGQGGLLTAGATPVFLDGQAGRRGPFRFNGTVDFNTLFPATIPGPITGI
jgi:hypothetical protein